MAPGARGAASSGRTVRGRVLTLAKEQAMANLFLQHECRRNQSEAIGNDHRPISAEQAKQRPDRNAAGEQAVHRQRNGARVIRAQRLEGLWEEAQGGERRGHVAD